MIARENVYIGQPTASKHWRYRQLRENHGA